MSGEGSDLVYFCVYSVSQNAFLNVILHMCDCIFNLKYKFKYGEMNKREILLKLTNCLTVLYIHIWMS
jgi:hypothetical protein